MDNFFQGMIACIAILGGLCGFMYWMFCLLEKKLESKIDAVSADIHKIVEDLREERRSKDALYKFVLDNYKN